MPDTLRCPRCYKVGLVRLETVIRGRRSLRHFYCGACGHEWELTQEGSAPTKGHKEIGRPDRSRP
jgi:transcription elongation factor Elf1